jgi:CRP-like cAMP-binding protein
MVAARDNSSDLHRDAAGRPNDLAPAAQVAAADTAPPPVSTTDEGTVVLPPGLDSGDVVLFNRRCMSMSPQGAALCAVAKLLSNSRWDHVGVVVRHPTSKELLFLEADFGGVKLRSLSERVRRSKSNEIAVRKLSVVRTDAMRAKLYAFASRMLGRPYEIGTADFLMARVADPYSKSDRDRRHALLVEKRAAVHEIDRELRSVALTPTSRRVLSVERARVVKLIADLESALIQELGAPSSANQLATSKDDLSRVFCSELVAAAYQDIGLLDSYPLAAGYNPKDFSSEQTNPPGLHLLKGARLAGELFFRRQEDKHGPLSFLFPNREDRSQRQSADRRLDSEPTLWGRGPDGAAKHLSKDDHAESLRVRGIATGDPPGRESRRLIREVLKRTPLYDKVPDEYKWSHLSKSFTACVVEAGDVVFTQGDYGDRIYVIESGAVDRFVAKGADEDPVLVHSMGPRNSFGLTGFSFNCQRGATIRASERTLLWSVDRTSFELFRDTSSPIQSLLSEADLRTLRGLLKEHFLFKRLDTLGPFELNMFFAVKFRAGEEIFKQGDRGDNFYIIKSGEVERHIRHPRPTGEDGDSNIGSKDEEYSSLASTLWPGQSFGELSIMYNAPRSATVRARTDTECWAISSESFHQLNIGQGTYYLQAIFKRFASVTKDTKSYMTPTDLLSFADVAAFQDEACRTRLSALLISLVTSNREQDPIRSTEKYTRRSTTSIAEETDGEILMDFWEFVRFDLVLNQPSPENDFAFRLANQSNTGFVSLHEMHALLQDYADIDSVARDLLSGKNPGLAKVFGRDGSRVLSAKEFRRVSSSILPPTFREDLEHLVQHMLNMDVSTNTQMLKDPDLEKLSFIEPDGSPTMLGSQFVASTRAGTSSHLSLFGTSMPWAHMLSIFVSGTASRTFVAPFDRLKIIMQTQPRLSRYRGIRTGLAAMIREDTGIMRALFRGNGANVIRIVPSAAIQLMVVDRLHKYANSPAGLSRDTLGVTNHSKAVNAVVIGGLAGMVAAAATYPLDYMRGRLALQKRGFERYRGTWHGLRLSVQEEGALSMYRGLTPSLLGVFPYVGLSFAMYETVQPLLPKKNDGSSQPTWSSQIVAGVLASATGQVASYPLDTVRRRMQVAGFAQGCDIGREGMVRSLRQIVRQEGIRGLFRGLTPNLVKATPAGAVSFFVYERCSSGLDAFQYLLDRDARPRKSKGSVDM